MRFSDFLDCLEDSDESSPVLYMQQQNSNLTGEMSCLVGDVPEDIDWATKAFGQKPDAANFWLGDGRAVTSSKLFKIMAFNTFVHNTTNCWQGSLLIFFPQIF